MKNDRTRKIEIKTLEEKLNKEQFVNEKLQVIINERLLSQEKFIENIKKELDEAESKLKISKTHIEDFKKNVNKYYKKYKVLQKKIIKDFVAWKHDEQK